MNKRLFWVLVLSAWGSLLGNVANAEEKPLCDPTQSKIGAAKIAAVQGKVEAKRTTDETWHSAKRNAIYCPGDQIRVGKDSRASIVLSNETLVRLDQYSVITLSQIDTEGPSLLELVQGIAHFISRVPRSLKVNTPFVNAAIEGTEFVVAVKENDTTVTVFEGIVLTENENGQVRLTQNESSIAKEGQAPEKILLAKPRDTVQWALYFPPIINGDAGGSSLQQASSHLYNGRVEEASALLAEMAGNGDAKALQAIIAIVNNDTNTAFKLAGEAIQLSSDSAAPHIAMSYAWQSQLDLEQALSSAEQATNKVPDNAIAWARLAELQLSVGNLSDALSSAKKASDLDSSIAHAQTILGYAYLTQIKTSQARATFNKAIELDQSDPLPHLGLGLAMIRKNELAAGRREIEIAASLDPNNAIIRSYLGKAYYEEKRGPLDAEQFAMAKALDPNDPTPYFYDAIRKQTENNPVGALEDLNKSITQNNNRVVYRSSLQLDQDEAARNASIGRIYQTLRFDQLAVNSGSSSLALDPANHSAHQLLADAYLSKPGHEIARISEQLQAKIFNPLNSNPQQAQLTEGSLPLLSNLGPGANSLNEYNNLFQRNHISAVINGLTADKNTKSTEVIVSGIYNNFAFSAGTYHHETDGYHSNNGLEQDLDNIFLQYQINTNLSIFFEHSNKEETRGDDYRFDPTNFSTTKQIIEEDARDRVGLRFKPSPHSTFVASYLNNKIDFIQTEIVGVSDVVATSFDDGEVIELRYISDIANYSYTIGYTDSDIDTDTEIIVDAGPPSTFSGNSNDSSAYLYSYLSLPASVNLTLGVSHETYKDGVFDLEKTNPKLGIEWLPYHDLNVRLAYFSKLRRTTTGNATIEPTMVAGFNQFYDDDLGTEAEQSAIAVDYRHSKDLTLGMEYIYRDLDVPRFGLGILDQSYKLSTGYLYWTPGRNMAMNFKLQRESIHRGAFTGNLTYENVLTHKIPIGMQYYFEHGFSADVTFTYIKQEGRFIDLATATAIPGEDDFWVTDLFLKYNFPKRYGSISIGVKNLFDETFNYEETDKRNPGVAPEQTVFARLNLLF